MKIVLLVLAALGWLSVAPSQEPAPAKTKDEKLDPAIPKADPEKYQSIRDAKEWGNPYLVIRADGVEVVSKEIAKGRQLVAPKELAKTLVGLPVRAWPYGRVVGVQEIGLRSDKDEQSIKENREAVKAVLEKLDVKGDLWPS